MEGGDRENQTPAPPTANGGGKSMADLVKEKDQKVETFQLLEKRERCITNFQDEHSEIEGLEDIADEELVRPRKVIKLFGVDIDCGAGAAEGSAQSNVDAQNNKTSGKETHSNESDYKN